MHSGGKTANLNNLITTITKNDGSRKKKKIHLKLIGVDTENNAHKKPEINFHVSMV